MKKVFRSLFSLFIISGLLSTTCFASTCFTNTPLRAQDNDDSCWAASCQMLLETRGRIFTQAAIEGSIYGPTITQVRNRLITFAPDIQWDITYGPFAFERVQGAINTGWAIYTSNRLIVNQVSYGHAMVITGYDQTSSGYNNVWLQDPWGNDDLPHRGAEGWCNYAAPVEGNYAGTPFVQWQNYKWTYTIC